jgi:hypothetical protein
MASLDRMHGINRLCGEGCVDPRLRGDDVTRHRRKMLASWTKLGFELAAAVVLLACATGALAAEPAVKPKRIVSLDLCTDQLLVELVDRTRIAAVTHLLADPAVSAIPEQGRGLAITRATTPT